MIREVKAFNGATLNSDSAIEYTKPNDILDGLNVRIQTRENNREGYVVTIEGNRQIVNQNPLPAGTNRVAGVKHINETSRTYIFIQNSDGNHRIDIFNPADDSFVTLYEELTDSNSVAILDLQSDEYVKDILLVGVDFLVFTIFPRDEVKMVNIPLALGGAYAPFRPQDFYLGTVPTPTTPTVSYHDSGNFVTDFGYNNLKGKLFQFRYRYKYIDGRYSDYSAISERPTPTSEMDDQGNIEQQDIIGVSLPAIDPRVAEVEISARDGANDWYTVLTKERQWFLDLPVFSATEIPNPPDPPLFVFRYDIPQRYPLNGGFYIPFTNEGLYPHDIQIEHDLIASAVPINTRSIEFVNGTNLLLGNNRNGYPRPSMPDQFSANITMLPSPIEEPDDPDTFRVYAWHRTPGEDYMREEIVFDGVPAIGDTIVADFRRTTSSATVEIAFAVTSAEAGNPYSALQEWLDLIIDEFGTTAIANAQVITTPQEGLPAVVFQRRYASISWMDAARVELSGSVNELNISEGIVKTGSSYSLVPSYYDYLGRPLPLPKDAEVTVKTPTMAESEGMVPAISWSLTGPAPANAAKYTIVVSRNRTHVENWSVVARVDPDDSTPDVYHFDVTSLYIFNRDRQGAPPSYDFASGDLVHIISNVNPSSGVRSNWVNNPVRIFDVMSLTPVILEEDDPLYNEYPDHTKWILKVQRPATDQFDPGQPVLLEIYRPVKSSEDQKIFFEVGLPLYDVIDGEHSVESGTITKLDSFIKLRRVTLPWEELNPNVDVVVESFHFSDNYISNFYSYGRPRSYNDTPEGTVNYGEIRWSDVYIRDTDINNIGRFYPENIFQVDHSYGGIQYLYNRENRIMCIQETKIGYIPVHRSILMDNAQLQQVAISEKLLNPINYYSSQNIGIGSGQFVMSAVQTSGSVYFIDPDEMLPARAGLDGTRHISGNYSGELKRRIREATFEGEVPLGMWDDRMSEYLIRFDDFTYVYDEKSDGWIPKRSVLPEAGFSTKDRMYTFNLGELYVHDDELNRNRFYGVSYGAELVFPVASLGVKNYMSLALHMDDEVETTEEGIKTQLGQLSNLLAGDFQWLENIWYADFLRDQLTDINTGDILKGRWITIHLVQSAPVGEWNLLYATIKSTVSTINE